MLLRPTREKVHAPAVGFGTEHFLMKRKYLWMVRRAYRALRHPRLRHREWWQKLTRPLMQRELWKPCRDTVATGMAIGLFFGMLPMLPQSLFAAITAMKFRVNVPFAVAATWLSNPLTNVPIWAAQLWLGNRLQEWLSLPEPEILGTHTVRGLGLVHAGNFMLGAGVSGLLLGMLAFPLVHLFSAVMPHHLPKLPRRKGVKIIPAVPRSSGN